MPRNSRRRSGGRGGGSKRRYRWFGNQFPVTSIAVTSARTFVELVSGAQLERLGGGTLQRIRGSLHFSNTGTDAVNGGCNIASIILAHTVNDAQAIEADLQPTDNNEEDIARRVLWSRFARLSDLNNDPLAYSFERIEIDIRVKVILLSTGKHSLWLAMDNNFANRGQVMGYLRALVKY